MVATRMNSQPSVSTAKLNAVLAALSNEAVATTPHTTTAIAMTAVGMRTALSTVGLAAFAGTARSSTGCDV